MLYEGVFPLRNIDFLYFITPNDTIKMNKNLFYSGLIAIVISLGSMGLFASLYKNEKTIKVEHVQATPAQRALYSVDQDGNIVPLDFNQTAEKVLETVVYIKSTQLYSASSQPHSYPNIPAPFRDFFGEEFDSFFGPRFRFETPRSAPGQSPARVGTGSGVIISEDGYIVTNNHVIANADDIEVTLHDNRNYKGTVIGTDPSTDLALIQIKEKQLPKLAFRDADDVKVGQWVLAVGNPMGLNSTVTAGIVSAKGRSINILKDKYAVENFIQTDAAINPGNSGGALVDLDGSLIGINTAIASPTGTFAGYGFAVPSDIVEKVVRDLLEYGVVQRGVLGVMIRTVDGNLAKEKTLKINQGVYVDSLLENSAAAKSGIESGDVIVKVNGKDIHTSAELQGAIAQHRPGEEVTIEVNRGGRQMSFQVILNNPEGNTSLATKEKREVLQLLGVELEEVDKELAKKLEIKGGVKVTELFPGKLKRETQIRKGFIITKVDGKSIRNVEEVVKLLEEKKGGIMLEGVYEDALGEFYYAFGL